MKEEARVSSFITPGWIGSNVDPSATLLLFSSFYHKDSPSFFLLFSYPNSTLSFWCNWPSLLSLLSHNSHLARSDCISRRFDGCRNTQMHRETHPWYTVGQKTTTHSIPMKVLLWGLVPRKGSLLSRIFVSPDILLLSFHSSPPSLLLLPFFFLLTLASHISRKWVDSSLDNRRPPPPILLVSLLFSFTNDLDCCATFLPRPFLQTL